MYRSMVMFPTSTDPLEVDALIDRIAASFKASVGSEPITRNAGALMGPAAKDGVVGSILEADFPSLDAAMTAMQAEDFQVTRQRTEDLGCTIFLYEVQDV